LAPELDHLILAVHDRDGALAFYTGILGLVYERENDPFTVVRVTPNLTLQLAPWGTQGGEHLAFSMSRSEFDAAFERIKRAGLEYGDSFHSVGNMRGPGEEEGARGPGRAVYVFDPSKHLIEIRNYDSSKGGRAHAHFRKARRSRDFDELDKCSVSRARAIPDG
jgi:catechol 2,3-dioxygenase-like lactoylglutathione lyase family enzyme